MQDPKPKPSIVEGLRKFYTQYDPKQVPSDDVLQKTATDFAGREGDLWGDLITNYTGSKPPQEHIDQLVAGFSNPYLEDVKKKVPSQMVPVLEMPPLRRKHLLWRIWSKITSKINWMRSWFERKQVI